MQMRRTNTNKMIMRRIITTANHTALTPSRPPGDGEPVVVMTLTGDGVEMKAPLVATIRTS